MSEVHQYATVVALGIRSTEDQSVSLSFSICVFDSNGFDQQTWTCLGCRFTHDPITT